MTKSKAKTSHLYYKIGQNHFSNINRATPEMYVKHKPKGKSSLIDFRFKNNVHP